MNNQERELIYTILLRLIDSGDTLTPTERHDLLDQLCLANCNQNMDDIISAAQNRRRLLLKRGTALENAAFTGMSGEVTVDTTNKTLRVHDGQTAGGTILAKQSDIQTAPSMAEIMSAMIPDYTAGVSVLSYTSSSNQFTAPADGILSIMIQSYYESGVYINGVCVADCNGTNVADRESIIICIKQGDTFYAPHMITTSRFTPMFFPFRGA